MSSSNFADDSKIAIENKCNSSDNNNVVNNVVSSSPQFIVRHSISDKSVTASTFTFTLEELIEGIKSKTLPPQIFSFVSANNSNSSNSSGASNLCAMRAHNMHSDYLGKIISLVPSYATNYLSSDGKWCLCVKFYKTFAISAV